MYEIKHGKVLSPHIYHGVPTQRGAGLGSLLGSIGRIIAPTLKSAGKSILHEGLRTGTNILSDVLSGQNVKTATKKRVKKASNRILKKAARHMKGSGIIMRQRKKSKRKVVKLPGLRSIYKRKPKHRKTQFDTIVEPDIFS